MALRPLPIPVNHRPSVSNLGSPIHDSRQFSRRNFIKLAGAGAAAGTVVSAAPAAAQSMTSSERALLLLAIDVARDAGAHYSDGRVIRTQFEAVGARELRVSRVQSTDSFGINIRVLVGGSWGFSATQVLTREAVTKMARDAVAIATANNAVAPSTAVLAPGDV